MSASQKTDEDFDKLLFPDADEVTPPSSDTSPEPTGRHFTPALQGTKLPSTRWPNLIISKHKK